MAAPGKPRRSTSTAQDWRASMREAGPYLGLGMQLAMTMVFFTVGGYLLDYWLGWTPGLTIAGALLGMVAIFVHLFRVSSDLSKASKKRPSPPAEEEG